MMEEIYFRKRKKARIKKLDKGDVFVAEIFDDIFVYGQVVNPCIDDEIESFFDKNVVVVFYQIITKGIDVDFYNNSEKRILLGPRIILRKVSFNNGALKLIGINHCLPKISYGFFPPFSRFKKCRFKNIGLWIDENYHIKIFKPKYVAAYGICTEYGMENGVKRGIEKYKDTLQVNGINIKDIL